MTISQSLITVPAREFGQIQMAYADCQGYLLDSLSPEERTRIRSFAVLFSLERSCCFCDGTRPYGSP